MKLMVINLISILLTHSSSGSKTQCGPGEECIYKDWMPWQPCTGSCGQETQIRQRVFCCPGSLMNISVALRTLDLCTKTCKTPKHYLTEGKHCHRCSNNGFYNRTAKACVCRKRNKGQCCQGEFNTVYRNIPSMIPTWRIDVNIFLYTISGFRILKSNFRDMKVDQILESQHQKQIFPIETWQ